jgi:hypothetical protein
MNNKKQRKLRQQRRLHRRQLKKPRQLRKKKLLRVKGKKVLMVKRVLKRNLFLQLKKKGHQFLNKKLSLNSKLRLAKR